MGKQEIETIKWYSTCHSDPEPAVVIDDIPLTVPQVCHLVKSSENINDSNTVEFTHHLTLLLVTCTHNGRSPDNSDQLLFQETLSHLSEQQEKLQEK